MTKLTPLGDPDALACADGVCRIPVAATAPEAAEPADEAGRVV
jgi:hypothetical protein